MCARAQVAQQFIWKHQLDQSVLQTIANFIIVSDV
jgi:hypothetical protein